MKLKLIPLFIAIVILAGCTAQSTPDVKTEAQVVPEWLITAVKAEFQTPELVKPEEITFMQVNLKHLGEQQILAYLSLDRINGVLLLFEKQQDGGYKEVYKRNEPVYGVQVFGAGSFQLIAYTSGLGGTGMQENSFHILGYTQSGYKEFWSGIAEYISFNGPLPYTHIQGAINLNMQNDRLVYTKYSKTYNKQQYEVNMPSSIETKTQYYILDAEHGEFELADER